MNPLWTFHPSNHTHIFTKPLSIVLILKKKIHKPFLYAIWNGKEFMVMEAIKREYFPNAKYFFWSDIGSWRGNPALPTRGRWPQEERIVQLDLESRFSNVLEPQVILEAISMVPSQRNFNPLRDIFAGIFGGTRESLTWFHDEFYKLHNERIDKGIFVGKDQTMINILAMRHPNRFSAILCYTASKSDPWFYFQAFYMNQDAVDEAGVKGNRHLVSLTKLIPT